MSGYHDNNNSSTKRNGKDSTIEPGIHMEYSLEQLKETLRSGVYSLCTAVGMTVVYKLMEEDVTALVGALCSLIRELVRGRDSVTV